MEIYTIGFTRKSAEEFFGILREHGIERLIDVRLNNRSQLAGFTKQDDLAFFLREVASIEYVHEPSLAPTEDLLKGYRKGDYSWDDYVQIFEGLLREREIEKTLDKGLFDRRAVLLCSEPTAENCHRRLVAEYLDRHWGEVEIIHL